MTITLRPGQSYTAAEEDATLAARCGDNEPLRLKPAVYDGHRSLRLLTDQGAIGLATATYSYQLTHDERRDVAARLAALWNLGVVMDWPTAEIEAAVRQACEKSRDSPATAQPHRLADPINTEGK